MIATGWLNDSKWIVLPLHFLNGPSSHTRALLRSIGPLFHHVSPFESFKVVPPAPRSYKLDNNSMDFMYQPW